MDRKEVAERAMQIVIRREKRKGRYKDDVHNDRCGYDILSSNRKIEVKGRTGTDHFIQMNYRNIQAFNNNPDFWLYIVHFDDNGKYKVIELNKKIVAERRKKRQLWEVPFYTAELK